MEHRLLNIDGQATFNRVADVGFDLLHGLALGGAARYRRDLGPEPSLLGFVDNQTNSLLVGKGSILRIPMMSISHSNLMPISSERSDAGLPQCARPRTSAARGGLGAALGGYL